MTITQSSINTMTHAQTQFFTTNVVGDFVTVKYEQNPLYDDKGRPVMGMATGRYTVSRGTMQQVFNHPADFTKSPVQKNTIATTAAAYAERLSH